MVPVLPKPSSVEVDVGHLVDTDAFDPHGERGALPSNSLDEMEAAEAARFKADVQGHRQPEVGVASHFRYANL